MGMTNREGVGRVRHPHSDKVMTKQADALASDINHIVDRYVTHGVLPPPVGSPPRYGDYGSGLDYHTAMVAVRQAQAQFEALPAQVRDFCANDPGRFLDQVMDPEGHAELLELGLDPGFVPAIVSEPEVPPAPEATETDSTTEAPIESE